MKSFSLVIAIVFSAITLSCGRSTHPCPTLSTTKDENGKTSLTKVSVATDKNGLVKKKGMRKPKKR